MIYGNACPTEPNPFFQGHVNTLRCAFWIYWQMDILSNRALQTGKQALKKATAPCLYGTLVAAWLENAAETNPNCCLVLRSSFVFSSSIKKHNQVLMQCYPQSAYTGGMKSWFWIMGKKVGMHLSVSRRWGHIKNIFCCSPRETTLDWPVNKTHNLRCTQP